MNDRIETWEHPTERYLRLALQSVALWRRIFRWRGRIYVLSYTDPVPLASPGRLGMGAVMFFAVPILTMIGIGVEAGEFSSTAFGVAAAIFAGLWVAAGLVREWVCETWVFDPDRGTVVRDSEPDRIRAVDELVVEYGISEVPTAWERLSRSRHGGHSTKMARMWRLSVVSSPDLPEPSAGRADEEFDAFFEGEGRREDRLFARSSSGEAVGWGRRIAGSLGVGVTYRCDGTEVVRGGDALDDPYGVVVDPAAEPADRAESGTGAVERLENQFGGTFERYDESGAWRVSWESAARNAVGWIAAGVAAWLFTFVALAAADALGGDAFGALAVAALALVAGAGFVTDRPMELVVGPEAIRGGAFPGRFEIETDALQAVLLRNDRRVEPGLTFVTRTRAYDIPAEEGCARLIFQAVTEQRRADSGS